MAERDQAIRDLVAMPSPERPRQSLPKTEAFMTAKRTGAPGYVGPQEISPVLQELRTAEQTAATRAGEAEVAVEEAKFQEKGREAGLRRQLVEKQAEEIKALPERQQLTAKREELANAAFAPTRDNVNDIAGLFSIIGVIGMAMGGGGKGAALQAMNAMNGMVEGYRRGRADLYKQQLTEFDRSVKTMQQQISTLEKAYTEAMNLKAIDRQAGELRIQELLAASESPVLKAMRARQGDVAALNLIRNTVKDVGTVATMQNALQTAADNRATRAAEAQAARDFREQQAELQREFMAGQRELDRSLRREQMLAQSDKLSPKEKEEIRGTNRLAEEIQVLRETFQPRFVNFKADVAGDITAKYQARFRDDPAMAEWWRRYESVALPERHAMFGATLTGKEQESWRKASIGPGNSTAEVFSWMGDKDRILQQKLRGYESKAVVPAPIAPPAQTPTTTPTQVGPATPARTGQDKSKADAVLRGG
jgi:hypothetical protein